MGHSGFRWIMSYRYQFNLILNITITYQVLLHYQMAILAREWLDADVWSSEADMVLLLFSQQGHSRAGGQFSHPQK